MSETSTRALWFGPGLSALRRPFDYDGRATRSEVLSFAFLTWLIQLVLGMMAVTIHSGGADYAPARGWLEVMFLPWWIALLVRRAHDQGRPGWWLLLIFAAVYLFLALAGLMPQATSGSYRIMLYFWAFRPEPGWLTTLHMIAGLFGLLGAIGMVFGEGQQGANRYGPDPRQGRDAPPAQTSVTG